MEHGHLIAETPREAAHRLRRERDLGHEHDGTLPLLKKARDRLEVDFRLAAARDTVQQHGRR